MKNGQKKKCPDESLPTKKGRQNLDKTWKTKIHQTKNGHGTTSLSKNKAAGERRGIGERRLNSDT